MKKLSALLLSSLLLSLPACDGGSDDSDTAATGTTDTDASGSETGASGSNSGTDTNDTNDPSAGETEDPSAGDETGDPSDTTDPTGGGEPTCQYRCSSDADCFSNGTDLGLTCTSGGFCLNLCESDDDCVAQLSGWSFQPCDSNDTCAAGPCVDLGNGSGGCGTAPSEFLTCDQLMMEEVEVTDIDGNPATVCGNTSGTCVDIGTGDMTCTIETEVQTCEETGCPEGYTCAADGACHCDSDEVCGEGGMCNADGFCVNPCADASECNAALPFDGGEYVCE